MQSSQARERSQEGHIDRRWYRRHPPWDVFWYRQHGCFKKQTRTRCVAGEQIEGGNHDGHRGNRELILGYDLLVIYVPSQYRAIVRGIFNVREVVGIVLRDLVERVAVAEVSKHAEHRNAWVPDAQRGDTTRHRGNGEL